MRTFLDSVSNLLATVPDVFEVGFEVPRLVLLYAFQETVEGRRLGVRQVGARYVEEIIQLNFVTQDFWCCIKYLNINLS